MWIKLFDGIKKPLKKSKIKGRKEFQIGNSRLRWVHWWILLFFERSSNISASQITLYQERKAHYKIVFMKPYYPDTKTGERPKRKPLWTYLPNGHRCKNSQQKFCCLDLRKHKKTIHRDQVDFNPVVMKSFNVFI